MGPLTDNPGTSIHKINWRSCPAALRSEFRRIVWVLINGELRPTYVQERGFQNRARDGVISMRDNIVQWMKFARWLDRQGVSQLSDCTMEHWKAYAAESTSGCTREYTQTVLCWLSDLSAFDQLSISPCGATRPLWEDEGIDDYLPAETAEAGGENKTEPLDPTVIGPLLTDSQHLGVSAGLSGQATVFLLTNASRLVAGTRTREDDIAVRRSTTAVRLMR
ncbi:MULTISPECIES: hypothetical protein [unclassified Streptomyces]|uniref:hypothetical protein n=1 Tax=unclassified Streptomyces TaxID=2593676 RepID=UPI0013DB14D1|nr:MULTISPECIES: hypothetical protein [unclassified Streptomyces]NMI55726.1 hypothetical protein [Streptomyces sp. RLA2-12]